MTGDEARPLVVIARQSGAIDLTASLLRSTRGAIEGRPRPVHWILEDTTPARERAMLHEVAHIFQNRLPIRITSVNQVSERNEAWQLVTCLLEAAPPDRASVRFHHGGIRSSRSGCDIELRDFRVSGNRVEGSESGRPGTYSAIASGDELFLSGSAHLFLADRVGELSHLPWYAIDSGEMMLSVEEVISPSVVSSASRYAKSGPLKPRGYFLSDYDGCAQTPPTASLNAVSWLFDGMAPVKSKGAVSSKGVQGSLDRRAKCLRGLIHRGIVPGWDAQGVLTSHGFEVIDALLSLQIVARILEREVRRGDAEPDVIAALSQVLPLHDMDHALAWSMSALAACEAHVADFLGLHPQYAPNDDRRAGALAKRSLALACEVASAAISTGNGVGKATLPRLLKVLGSAQAVIDSMQSLIEARQSRPDLRVEASVVAFR